MGTSNLKSVASVRETVSQAKWEARAYQMQMQTLAGGAPLTALPAELIEKASQQALHWKHIRKLEWPALKKLLDEKEPDYKN